jgi:Uma2 family endonuclease
MIATIQRHYSLDEYRAIADTSEEKCEYHDGEIIAMTGGTVKHSRISRNILILLDTKLKIRTLKPLTMTYGYGFLIIGVAYTQMRWFLMGLYNLTASPKGMRPAARMKF